MTLRVSVWPSAPDQRASEDVDQLLDAVEELGGEIDAEPGALIRQITVMLKKQAEFNRLKARFGASLPP